MKVATNPQYVRNAAKGSGVWHKVLTASFSIPHSAWKTHCGWHFGGGDFELTATEPPRASHTCEKCFRERPRPESHSTTPSRMSSGDEDSG